MKPENEESGVLVEDTITQDEIDSATKGSKYLTTAPGYKSKFDVVDILTNGSIPVFESVADKLVCAMELGQLVRKTGVGTHSLNIVKFLEAVDIPHRVIFLKQLPLFCLEAAARDEYLGPLTKELMVSIGYGK